MLLPRQFHVEVVENNNEAEIKRAAWLFPLYLVLINLFVLPIALAGLMTFPAGQVDSDMFVLALPLHGGANTLAPIAFIGGLSAATAMVIVEIGRALDHGVERHCRAVGFAAPRRLHHRTRACRRFAAHGAPHGDLRDPAARLSLLSIGRRRSARRNRIAVVCRNRATRTGILRRADLAPRHGARRHRRPNYRHRHLGLYAAPSQRCRYRHHRPADLERRSMGHCLVAAASIVWARIAPAAAWRDLVAHAQHPRLRRIFAAAQADPDRTAAVRPVCSAASRPHTEFPVAVFGDRRGTDDHRVALPWRGTHPHRAGELSPPNAASVSIPRPMPISSCCATPSIYLPLRLARRLRGSCSRCSCASARCRPRPRSKHSTMPTPRSTTTAKYCRPPSTMSAKASRSTTRTCT